MNNISTTLYLIISCPQNIYFVDKLIDITKVKDVKKELIKINDKNELFLNLKEISDSIKEKNIYLFKAVINLKNLKESINVKINYLNKNLISTKPIKFQKKK